MKIYTTDNGVTSFELTDEEDAAIAVAKLIVARRAREKGGKYDEQNLEFLIFGNNELPITEKEYVRLKAVYDEYINKNKD